MPDTVKCVQSRDPEFQEPLDFVPFIRATICVPCTYTVPKNALRRHLSETHGIQYRQVARILSLSDSNELLSTSIDPVTLALWKAHKSGAYILKDIANRLQDIHILGHNIEVRWIPAHIGIPGNEAADRAAKEAAGWTSGGGSGDGDGGGGGGGPGPQESAPCALFSLRTTLNTWAHVTAHQDWASQWTSSTKGRSSHRLTPKPTARVLQLHRGLKKSHSSLLVQMRTEKIGLQDFLFRRRVPSVTDPSCHCNEGRQTVQHVLLRCRKYARERVEELGSFAERHDLRAVLNTRKLATKAIKLMERTRMLGQFGILPA